MVDTSEDYEVIGSKAGSVAWQVRTARVLACLSSSHHAAIVCLLTSFADAKGEGLNAFICPWSEGEYLSY